MRCSGLLCGETCWVRFLGGVSYPVRLLQKLKYEQIKTNTIEKMKKIFTITGIVSILIALACFVIIRVNLIEGGLYSKLGDTTHNFLVEVVKYSFIIGSVSIILSLFFRKKNLMN